MQSTQRFLKGKLKYTENDIITRRLSIVVDAAECKSVIEVGLKVVLYVAVIGTVVTSHIQNVNCIPFGVFLSLCTLMIAMGSLLVYVVFLARAIKSPQQRHLLKCVRGHLVLAIAGGMWACGDIIYVIVSKNIGQLIRDMALLCSIVAYAILPLPSALREFTSSEQTPPHAADLEGGNTILSASASTVSLPSPESQPVIPPATSKTPKLKTLQSNDTHEVHLLAQIYCAVIIFMACFLPFVVPANKMLVFVCTVHFSVAILSFLTVSRLRTEQKLVIPAMIGAVLNFVSIIFTTLSVCVTDMVIFDVCSWTASLQAIYFIFLPSMHIREELYKTTT
jgi:hypothetical protein